MSEYEQHLLRQAESIDVTRLLRALSMQGQSTPVSQEEAAASLGELVNRLTLSVTTGSGVSGQRAHSITHQVTSEGGLPGAGSADKEDGNGGRS